MLCCALAVHVFDEAVNNFLALYNPVVHAIRQRISWLPLPTFTFGVWLTLLITAIVVLLFLTVFAYRGSSRLRPLAYFFSVFMLANGIQHILGSLYLGRFAAGVYSSPLLIAASIYLFVALRRTRDAS